MQKLLTLECLIVPGAIQSVVILIRILPQRERDMEEGCEKPVAIETEELSVMWSGGGVTSKTRQLHDSDFHSSLRSNTNC